MQILIIGSKGFIGSHLVSHFNSDNQNNVFGCDIIEDNGPKYFRVDKFESSYETILKSHPFDVCIYAGGNGSVPYSIENPETDFQLNTIGINRILTSIQKFQPKCKFIHFSSAAVYGNPVFLPINEESKIEPLSPYGWHKYMSEIICKKFTSLYNLPTISLRVFSVYGEGLMKQLFWDLHRKIKTSKEVTLFGTGSESRDFIHISDLVNAIELLIKKAKFQSEVYNIGTGKEITIKEAANTFAKIYDSEVKIKFGGEIKEGDPINWRTDISKIKEMGFHPSTELSKGLQQYIQWIREKELR
ncbi:MAG: NAD-dependent epimerase/dehydratase family protein [Bacteroidetes bacterium]|nr:NAD-dependent epimerase/dehydratase family protein [Bacteroidota bacterium]